MHLPSKKSLLAINIGMILSASLLTACGLSDEIEPTEEAVVTPEQQGSGIKAYANDVVFEPMAVAHWTPRPVQPNEVGDSEETTQKMFVQGDNLVLFTRWHNGIVRFDKNAKDKEVNSQVFATLVTSKEHVVSASDDIVSGASEHTLTNVQYTKDGKNLYALVKPEKVEIDGDDTYGLFKVALNADGSLPSSDVNGKTVTHKGNNVQHIPSKSINNILSLDNGALLAWNPSDNVIVYLDEHFEPQEKKSVQLDGKVQAWTADDQSVYLLVEKDGNQSIEKRAINSLAKVEKSETVNDVNDILVAGSNIILVGTEGVHLFDKDFKKLDDVSISSGIELSKEGIEASLATDGSRLAVKNTIGEIFLVDIANNKLSNPIKVSLNDHIIVGKFTLGDKDTLYYNNKLGAVSKINLNQKMVELNKTQVIQSSLDNLNIKAFNSGYPASTVVTDLSLPSQDKNEPIAFTWVSSNPSIIGNDGKVTRPNGGQAQEVTLTVTGTMEGATANKVFKLTVLPTVPEKADGKETNLGDSITKVRYNYNYGQYSSNAANDDGSLYALFYGKALVVLHKEDDNTVKPVEVSIDNAGLADAEVKTVVWQGNDTLWALLGNGTSGKLVKKTFNADLAANADTDWTVVKTFDKPVIAGFINAKKTHITAVTEQGNNSYLVQNFDVQSGAEVSQYTTAMNLSQNYVTVDDSGDNIFITTRDRAINGGTLYRLNKGQVTSEFVVDEPYHSGVVTSNGDFVAGGRGGNLLFIKGATTKAKLTANDAKKVSFGRYAGTGRIYSLSLQGNDLFVSYRNIGTAIVDISNFDKPFESSFVPYEGKSAKFFLGLPSTNGQYLLQVGDRTGMFKVTALK